MSEREEALALANRLLDVPNADPDDDLRVLSRALVRSEERNRGQLVHLSEAIRKVAPEALVLILKGHAEYHAAVSLRDDAFDRLLAALGPA